MVEKFNISAFKDQNNDAIEERKNESMEPSTASPAEATASSAITQATEPAVQEKENVATAFLSPSLGEKPQLASLAAEKSQPAPGDAGGIDLSKIELTLKDDRYVSSLNPADIKVLRAAKALKDEWESLALLYVHEIILLCKDNLVTEIQNKNLLAQVLHQLQSQKSLDPQAIQFLSLIQFNKPLAEVTLALPQ